jgi:hypothetical protein
MALVLILHVMATAFLTGLIWTVQVVHYPSFRYVSSERFLEFSQFHQSAITFVVGPVMVFELVSGFALVAMSPIFRSPLFLISLVAIGLIWASTFFLSVPLHNRLLGGHDLGLINQLVLTNWPRTVLWSLRSLALATLLIGKFNG